MDLASCLCKQGLSEKAQEYQYVTKSYGVAVGDSWRVMVDSGGHEKSVKFIRKTHF
jgi:hypothetical protein